MTAVVATRPKAVGQGTLLLGIAFSTGLVLMGERLVQKLPNIPAPLIYCTLALALTPLLGLIFLAFRGYNWARITCISLVAIRVLFGVPRVISEFGYTPTLAIIGLMVIALELAAAYLLLSGPSNAWFRAVRRP